MSNVLERGIDWVLARVQNIPTTQLVTAVGIAAFVGTIVLWWLTSFLHSLFPTLILAWEPSMSMLSFISAWGVIAAGQFTMKRATDIDLAKAKASAGTEGTSVPPKEPQ